MLLALFPSVFVAAEVVFARPSGAGLFALLVAFAGFYGWAARERSRVAKQLITHPLGLRLIRNAPSPWRRRADLALFSSAAALIICGLMRLQYGGTTQALPTSNLDIAVVVDYSKSMLAQDAKPNRNARLELELGELLTDCERRGDRVGLVVFAGSARGLPLTRDTRLLKLYLAEADPRTESPGGTAIGTALKRALRLLTEAQTEGEANASGNQAIVLFTDGEDHSSKPLDAAKEAAKLGIKIFVVGIGSTEGEPVQKFTPEGEPDGYVTDEQGKYVLTKIDEPLLKSLAEATGGAYIHITADDFGLRVLREQLSSLAQTTRESQIEIHREEGVAWLLCPALFLLTLTLFLGEGMPRSSVYGPKE